jgi:2-polyprenyl-6-methoxyphenol hydroxylase-like FAD-dependent oxidoreductase
LANADQPVRKVTIVGGGSAGWMTAAVLSQWLSQVEIKVIESDEIGIIGVGEATIPHIRNLLALAGIDPLEMIAESKAMRDHGEFIRQLPPSSPQPAAGAPSNVDFALRYERGSA